MDHKEHRLEEVRQMEPLSGNIETASNLDNIHDDLILKRDKFEENLRVDRGTWTARERQLKTAGETIRYLEISCESCSDDIDMVTEDCSSRKTAKIASKSVREDVSTYMEESVKYQKASKEKKMELERSTFHK